METHLAAGGELVRRCAEVLRAPALAADFSANLLKICLVHVITFAYKSARFEYGRQQVGPGAVTRAFTRHWRESRRTRSMFAEQGGRHSLRARWEFGKVDLYSGYLILRLFANNCYRRLRG
jgi:hypothetical protein